VLAARLLARTLRKCWFLPATAVAVALGGDRVRSQGRGRQVVQAGFRVTLRGFQFRGDGGSRTKARAAIGVGQGLRFSPKRVTSSFSTSPASLFIG